MSEGQVKNDQPTQLNYVVPHKIQNLMETYCDQTLISPSSLIRHLVSEFVDGSRSLPPSTERHPRGRRTTVVLPHRLLMALDAKASTAEFGTKAAIIARLLEDYLPSRINVGEHLRVSIDLPRHLLDAITSQYGPGPPEALILKALEDLTSKHTAPVSELAKESV